LFNVYLTIIFPFRRNITTKDKAKQYIKTKVKDDHRSDFSNLSNGKEEGCKNQGFNRIRIRDLRDKNGNETFFWITSPLHPEAKERNKKCE